MSVSRENKEALNVTDDTRNIIFQRNNEKVQIEEGATVIPTRDISTDTVWGLFNWGSANWDSSFDNSTVVARVVNPNNKHVEHFCDDDFEDSTNTTGTWDTTDQQLELTDTQIGQSLSIYLNNNTITTATMNVDNTTNALLYLSADGGSNWESVTNSIKHTFTNTGTDLRWKIVASGGSVTIRTVTVRYN